MRFNEYQKDARSTLLPGCNNFAYLVFGLCGETGEVAEKFKKEIRKGGALCNDEFTESVAKELGDVLWYITILANKLGYDLEDIAQLNTDKLTSRKERNQIEGNGDDR